jgi:hypothetical protein
MAIWINNDQLHNDSMSRRISTGNHWHYKHTNKGVNNYDGNCRAHIIRTSPLSVAILDKYMKTVTSINNTIIKENIYGQHIINNVIINSLPCCDSCLWFKCLGWSDELTYYR